MNTAYKEFDVVVVGAGPGGLGAAIQAARNGAKVLLVEKNGYLGGNMTIGLPFFGFLDRDANVVMAGLPEEFMRDMRNYETAYGHAASEHCYCPMHNSVTVFDYELFKIVALRKVLDAGVELLLHCDVESVNVENKTLKSITLMGKGYRITVAAKVFIDGTGDGDMAYLTGASFEKGQKDTGVLQPSTLMFNMGNVDLNKTIEFLEEHPDIAKAFLSAVSKGYEFAIENPEEAADILVGAAPELDKELVLASQQYLTDQYQADAPYWGYMDPEVTWLVQDVDHGERIAEALFDRLDRYTQEKKDHKDYKEALNKLKNCYEFLKLRCEKKRPGLFGGKAAVDGVEEKLRRYQSRIEKLRELLPLVP